MACQKTESDVASAFTQDGAADALRSLSYGEAAAVQINSNTLLLMVRVDPLSVSSLDDLRSQIPEKFLAAFFTFLL